HWGPNQTLDWKVQTDPDGRFEWRDAPPDAVSYTLRKHGYLEMSESQSLEPRQEEHVITLLRAFRVTGKVTDAATGQPIDTISVIPGAQGAGSQTPQWARFNSGTQGNGAYEVALENSYFGPIVGHHIRIEAEGYKPAVSPVFREADGD